MTGAAPDRSHVELAAARLLASGSFHAQAVSRAYFAAFFVAEEALLAQGETRSKHSGVVSAFGSKVVRDGGLEESTGRLLRSLFERRNQADYLPIEVPAEEADLAIRDAERFVDSVQAWIGGRPEGSGS